MMGYYLRSYSEDSNDDLTPAATDYFRKDLERRLRMGCEIQKAKETARQSEIAKVENREGAGI